MAGGLILVFGIGYETAVTERGIGSGIHGGEIYLRGSVDDRFLGVGATKKPFGSAERKRIAPVVREFASHFDVDGKALLEEEYTRIGPASARPFASKYTWE
jgi:glutamate synthase domain-containing protein 3